MPRDYTKAKGPGNPNYKTGFCLGREEFGFYTSWQNMKARCFNPKHPKYARYGGRGVTVCKEWLSIEGFSTWALTSGWHKGLTIDRINNDGNYEPLNCRWVTQEDNSRRKCTTKIPYEAAEGIRRRIAEGEKTASVAKEYGVTHSTIRNVVRHITHVPDGECSKRLSEMAKNT